MSEIVAERGTLAGLAVLGIAALGSICEPGAIRVTNRPPDPVLVDANGEVQRDGFDALVAAVEKQRELGFIQHPTLELLDPDDAHLPSLRAAAQALEPCPRASTPPQEDPAGSCFPDPSLEWIDCVAPPDLEQAARALGRLLDAQNYPRLASVARVLPGDPGVALRALLAASAKGAPAQVPIRDQDPFDLFELDVIEVEREENPAAGCVAIAEHFLNAQSDREAPFRRPPLSTKQLVSPKRYRAAERPTILVGSPPPLAACKVASDESVGVARLLVELLAKGGSLPGSLLAGWQGDRGVRFACDDERTPWLYVAELSDPERAAAFAQAIQRMLPGAFGGASAAHTIGRRVVVISRGLDAGLARGWAIALETQQLAGFHGLQ